MMDESAGEGGGGTPAAGPRRASARRGSREGAGKKEGLSPPFHLHMGSAVDSVRLRAELNGMALKGYNIKF